MKSLLYQDSKDIVLIHFFLSMMCNNLLHFCPFQSHLTHKDISTKLPSPLPQSHSNNHLTLNLWSNLFIIRLYCKNDIISLWCITFWGAFTSNSERNLIWMFWTLGCFHIYYIGLVLDLVYQTCNNSCTCVFPL